MDTRVGLSSVHDRLVRGLRDSRWRRLAGKIGLGIATLVAPLAIGIGSAYADHVLSEGATGPRVSEVQQRLQEIGYQVGVDGEFGSETREAVTNFQSDRGLEADGEVGPETYAALGIDAGIDSSLPSQSSYLPPYNPSPISPNITSSGFSTSSGTESLVKRYVVVIPTGNAALLARARRCAGFGSAERSPLGSYFNAGAYDQRRTAESRVQAVKSRGCADAHVRYF